MAALFQGQQGTDKIAAIHARDKKRRQCSRISRVIPVQKVSTEPGQFFCVRESFVGFIEEALQGNKSQIVCGILRVQLETEIGGRNSMSYLVILALHIIRNEELICLGRKCTEVTPGF